MEHMHLLCAAHQNITDTGNNINLKIPVHTFLEDLVPVTAVNTAEENNFRSIQYIQIFERIFNRNDFFDCKSCFSNP